MGGKALSANVAIRLTKANYERLASECVAKLRAAYPGMRIEVLGNYLDKADFGDCDILIESSDAYDPHQAAGVLEVAEVVRNGPGHIDRRHRSSGSPLSRRQRVSSRPDQDAPGGLRF